MEQKKHRDRSFLFLLIAVACALIFGFTGLLLPESFRTGALELVMSPLQSIFYRLIGTLAGPMIFLSVVLGIVNIGDAATLGKLGKRMIFAFVGITALLAAIAVGVSALFYRLPLAPVSGGSSQAKALSELLVDLFPQSIVGPFASGNTLQVIVLALLVGIAMLLLGSRVAGVVKLLEELSFIVQKLMGGLSRVMPVYVFLALCKLIWNGSLSGFAGIWTFPLLFIGLTLAATAALFLITAARVRVSPFRLLRKGLKPFLIALTTGSSTAALDEIFATCEKRYGIDRSLTRFGVPLALVMYKTSSVLFLGTLGCYFASAYGLTVSPGWLLTAGFMAVVLTFAIPPVPGGGINNYTVLFLQLGLPEAGLALAFAADSMMEYFITGFNVLCQSAELLCLAEKVGLADENALKSQD